MNSGPGSNMPNSEQDDTERTVEDVAQGLNEVVRLNRLQFEAFADIRRDLQHLTQRIKEGELLLLPSAHRPSARTRIKRRAER